MDAKELGEIFKATSEDRKQLVREIAQFIRTREIQQGDHYAGYVAVSPDAEALAMAIEDEFLV
jgi:hypothetical protein